MEAELFHADGRTDSEAFRNFANPPATVRGTKIFGFSLYPPQKTGPPTGSLCLGRRTLLALEVLTAVGSETAVPLRRCSSHSRRFEDT